MRDRTVFVFGSNLKGAHGAGAALAALRAGFPMGLGVGLHEPSLCYAIPTKDCSIQTLPWPVIHLYVKQFIRTAETRMDLWFKVTRVGCGLAGLADWQVAGAFASAPSNCRFDTAWKDFLPAHARYWGTYNE